MWSSCVLLLLAASVAYGQKHCCYPMQWEGTSSFIQESIDDEGHSAVTTGQVKTSMDAGIQAIYSDERIVVGGQPREYKLLQLFAKNAQFIIVGNKCTRITIGNWSPSNHCVPDNATLSRQYYFGNKEQLNIREFAIQFAKETVELGVTDDCAPAVEKIYGTLEGTSINTVSGWYNVTLGIKDPNVFGLPAICNQAPLSTQLPSIVHRRKHSLVRPVY